MALHCHQLLGPYSQTGRGSRATSDRIVKRRTGEFRLRTRCGRHTLLFLRLSAAKSPGRPCRTNVGQDSAGHDRPTAHGLQDLRNNMAVGPLHLLCAPPDWVLEKPAIQTHQRVQTNKVPGKACPLRPEHQDRSSPADRKLVDSNQPPTKARRKHGPPYQGLITKCPPSALPTGARRVTLSSSAFRQE